MCLITERFTDFPLNEDGIYFKVFEQYPYKTREGFAPRLCGVYHNSTGGGVMGDVHKKHCYKIGHTYNADYGFHFFFSKDDAERAASYHMTLTPGNRFVIATIDVRAEDILAQGEDCGVPAARARKIKIRKVLDCED